MIIKDLYVSGFGRLQNQSFSFGPDINIISGHNEAGKSTLHSFIFHMLYGISRARGRASRSDAYSRYCPWDYPDSFGGAMRIIVNDVPYLIERSFNASKKSLTITNELTGTTVYDDEAYLNSLIGGVSENTFSNTVYISQLATNNSGDLAGLLKKQLLNMGAASSFNIDTAHAVRLLTEKKKALSAAIRSEALTSYYETLDNIEAVTCELNKKRDLLTALPLYSSDYAEELNKQNEKYSKDIDRINSEYKQLKKELEDANASLTKGTSKTGFAGRITKGILTGICLVISILLYIFDKPFAGILFLLTAIGILVLPSLLTFIRSKDDNAPSSCWPLKTDNNTFSTNYINYFNTGFDKLEKYKTSIDALKSKIAANQEIMLAIKSNSLDNAKLFWETDNLQITLDSLECKRAKLDYVISENKRLKSEIESIELAISTIKEISTGIHAEYAPKLNHKVTAIFNSITQNKHGELLISENLDILLNNGNKIIPIESLSHGTIEQIYLSLRLAAANILFDKTSLPIILDEVFAMYDNQRLAQTLKHISREYKGQTFIFSCQSREQLIAEKLDIPYTLIRL